MKGGKDMFWRRTTIFVFVFWVIGLVGCAGNRTTPVQPSGAVKPFDPSRFVVAGSGTNLPVTVKLAEAYAKKNGRFVEIPPSIGTDGATIALISGALELGLISRPLTSEEMNKGLKAIPYAKVGIVFGAPVAVPDNNMTAEELLKVHQGIKTTWSNGKTIFVIIREKHDSSNQVLYKLIPGFQDAIAQSIDQKRWQVAYKDAEVPPAILNTPWSLGLTDSIEATMRKSDIKALQVNGVAPVAKHIADGTYPYSKGLMFAYKGTLTERAKDFIDYVKSEEGKALITALGAVPTTE